MIARYSRPELAALWDDKYAVRAAGSRSSSRCARRWRRAGTVPARHRRDGRATRRPASSIPQRILEIEETTRHDVIAFLTHVEELAGEPARWLHLGMTSSDVLDTALALQTGRALDADRRGVIGARGRARRQAREHAQTPMIGRSHGIHAEPITAGLVFARWHAEVVRASSRVVRARHAIAVGKIAGAVGVYGNLDPAIERAALGKLGLEPETVATQIVARDRHAEVLCALALLGTAIEQIALGVRHWQRTEVGEAEEGFGAGPEGLLGDAAQEEPDPEREPDRARAAVARLRAGRPRGRRAVARARHLALERRARRDARRDDPRRLHGRARDRRSCSGLVVHARAHAREPRSHRRPVLLRGRAARARARPGCRARRRTRWCSARRSPRSPRPRAMGHVGAQPGRFRELLGADPDVASRLDARGARRLLRSRPPPAARARDPRARAREAPDDRSRRHVCTRSSRRRSTRTPWHAIGGRTLPRYDGKVRDCYIDAERGERVIVVTDRLSAFDAVVGTIPFKGQVLNQLAQFWFEHTRAHRAEPHAARARSERDDRARVRRRCRSSS